MRKDCDEQFLQDEGVEFEYLPSVPTAQISYDPKGLKATRAKGINPEQVELYDVQLLGGAKFPALLVYRIGKDRYGVIGGHHRLEAYRRRGVTETDVYVCAVAATDTRTINRLRAAHNVINGLPETHDERLERAAYWVDQLSYSQKDAAKENGLRPSALQAYIATTAARRRADHLGVEGLDGLSDTAIERLGTIKSDKTFEAAVKLAAETPQFTADHAKALSQEINTASQTSEQKALSVIARWRKDNAPRRAESAGGRIKIASVPHQFFNAIRSGLHQCGRLKAMPSVLIAMTARRRAEVREQSFAASAAYAEITELIDDINSRQQPNA